MLLQRKDFARRAVELGEHESGVTNRIDADVVPAAMRGAPGELDFDPDESAVRGADRESRRLGENRAFRA